MSALLRRAALPLGVVVLTLVFAVLQFPWERLEGRVADLLAAATGASVRIGAMGPGLGLAGPHVEAADVELRWPGGAAIALSHLRTRPAWSLSWLVGDPAVYVDLGGEIGAVRGTIWPGDAPAFRGEVRGLDPTRLPPALLRGVFPPLTGRLDADLDLATGEAGRPSGRLALEAGAGSLVLPESPVAIPYDRLVGRLEIAPDGGATFEGVRLEGPLVSLEGAGTLGAAPRLGQARLDLELRLLSVDPAFAGLARSLGLPSSVSDGQVFAIRGTVERPEVVSLTR